ncbi:MAG: MFS transporter [Phocaeicola vulgatus]|nr:MAG: MFS transporter [Phocaeicola vulgatus]
MESTVTNKSFLRSWILVVCVALIVRAAGNIFLPSISYMAADLNVDEAEATSNLNLYYIILAISYIALGPICDRYQKSKLLRLGLLGCIVGCVLSALAPNISILNIGRSIQALSAGVTMLSSQLWISEHSDKKRMMGQLAWFSMVAALAPLLAPVLGGCIADWLSWRYDFWLIVLLSIPVYILALDLKKADVPIGKEQKNITLQSILGNYKEVLLHSPLEKMSFSVQSLYWGQSCFITISSFLFINEMGINATQVGLLNVLFVCGLILGRFPAMYLQKHYSIRVAFVVNSALTLITTVTMLAYYFIYGSHTLVEIILLYSLQCIGFGGLSILGIRNCIVVGKKTRVRRQAITIFPIRFSLG